MKKKKEKQKEKLLSAKSYYKAIPDIFKYQVFSKLVLGILLYVLRQLAMFLIRSTGRVAISSGDFDFLYKSIQGPLLIIVALGALFLYTIIDLNVQIIYASDYLEGKKIDMVGIFRRGFVSIRDFFNTDGIGIVLYIALIAPIVGFGFSISLTRNFYIPTFISSVIQTTPLYRLIYTVAILGFLSVGLMNLFIIHGMLISKLNTGEAHDNSRSIIRKNWKNYLKQNFVFGLKTLLMNVTVIVSILILFMVTLVFVRGDEYMMRFSLIFASILLCALLALISALFQTFYIIKITRLYYHYMDNDSRLSQNDEYRFDWKIVLIRCLFIIPLILVAFLINRYFDVIVPDDYNVGIIAHRAGGVEAPENTVKGIEKAISLGAYGSEIDIQRTKDGYYIVNHDGDFSRLCSDSRTPEQMTLDEVKQLVINDPNHPGDLQQVATFEQMLEAAKGKIVLFVELKGETADKRMVDDAVRIIKEYDMLEECVIISLKYNLIDYAESTYPEVKTAYLTFASFGRTAELNCDYLGLEDESATDGAINSIHEQNKKIMVWTPNEEHRQDYFLKSDVDYIITDNIKQANEIKESIRNRDDFEKLTDWIISLF